MKNKNDLIIIAGLFCALVIFNLAGAGALASAKPDKVLHKQGTGSSYGISVDQRISMLESNCRDMLVYLAEAQSEHAKADLAGRYGWLQQLISDGYLEPNKTGKTLVNEYSITFFLNEKSDGFTLVAEPMNFDLRPYLITENKKVVPLTSSIEDDPTDEWKKSRTGMNDHFWGYGVFDYPITMPGAPNPENLQVRINREKTSYVIHKMKKTGNEKARPDESFLYSYDFRAYLYGDLRE